MGARQESGNSPEFDPFQEILRFAPMASLSCRAAGRDPAVEVPIEPV